MTVITKFTIVVSVIASNIKFPFKRTLEYTFNNVLVSFLLAKIYFLDAFLV